MREAIDAELERLIEQVEREGVARPGTLPGPAEDALAARIAGHPVIFRGKRYSAYKRMANGPKRIRVEPERPDRDRPATPEEAPDGR